MRITAVSYVNEYTLNVRFHTGESLEFDFKQFLSQSLHPQITKYLDKNKFKKVKLTTGFLTWNRGEMEISGVWIYT